MSFKRTIHARTRRRAVAALIAGTLAAALAAPAQAQASTIVSVAAPHAPAQQQPTASTRANEQTALSQARASGKDVPVASATTPTSTVTADPNGTLALSETAVPVRRYVDGSWQNLDATLVRNADGTIAPRASTDGLHLSPGGTGPLATMIQGADELKITLPVALPAPTLSGDTATYANLAPGVDLVVTATTEGGFSDVFVVRNRAAATSPALAALLKSTVTTSGLTVSNHGGALAAAGGDGRAVFAADTMTVWDSSTSVGPAPAGAARGLRTQGPDSPAASTVRGPGAGAHVGAITPTLIGDTLTLSPDHSVLAGSGTVYPVDIDPYWAPTEDGWATVAEQFPTQNEWNTTPESAGYMAVGDGLSQASILARSMVDFSLPSSVLSGATVETAAFSVTDEYAGACQDNAEDEQLDVHAPSQTLDYGNALWSDWSSSSQLGSTIGSLSFAYGYSTSCASGGSPSSATIGLSTGTFSNDVTAGKTTQTLALVADDESSENGWKDLVATTAKLTLTYDFVPQITSLSTNGNTSCSSKNPGLVGVGSVDLSAGAYQQDGSSLTADFRLYNAAKTVEYNPQSASGGSTTSASAAPVTSKTPATLAIAQSFFSYFGSGSEITFAWTVSVTDGTSVGTSAASTCYFTYDPTHPGAPKVTDASGNDCRASTLAYTVGSTATFDIAKNADGATPGSYRYQLNGAAPLTQAADSSGDATIEILPTRGINVLTITALSPTGNIGDGYPCTFSASATTSVDKNLTGSGVPDLLTVGGPGTGLAPGLWLAAGQGPTGAINTTATDIGVNGDGYSSDYAASDFNGDQAITGEFTADGLQDVLVYNPSTHSGAVLTAPGDGSALQTEDSAGEKSISGSALIDGNGDDPLQLADAYNAASSGLAYPDLIGTTGDSTHGYYLAYYPNGDAANAFGDTPVPPPIDSYDATSSSYETLSSPNGSSWSQWQIATALVPGASGNAVDMYLWNSTTHALYLWTGLTIFGYDTSADTAAPCTTAADQTGTVVCTASYSQTLVDADFNPGTGTTLEAAYIDTTDATALPDLWAVTAGVATPYLLTSLSSSGSTFTAGIAQSVDTADHSWALNSAADGTAVSGTGESDQTAGTALNLAATAGPLGHAGDLFNPDVEFTGSGYLSSSAPVATPATQSFTLSLWVKPSAGSGVVVSEEGTSDSLFSLYPSGSQWEIGMNDSATTSASYNTATGGAYTLGTWSHLLLTYSYSTATTGLLSLYQDGTLIADVTATNVPTVAGDFVLGAGQSASTSPGASPFSGEIADVQAWDSTALAPTQNYSPPSYHQAVVPERLLDTRITTGDNLTNGTTSASTPVTPDSTTILSIAGDTVTPILSTAPITIPSSVTAVAVDITAVSETANGFLVAYADGTQQPVTSATNYYSNTTITGYEIVPVGADGKIAIYNSSTGTTHLIVDLTGYFTSNATLTGDQTYHPLNTAYRALDTRSNIANTTGLSGTGPVAAGESFTLKINGVDSIPSNATAVAINLTTTAATGNGILEAYQTGTTQPTDTTLSYTGGQIASLAADVSIGSGTITIANIGSSATDIIGDIAGYYTTDTTGDVYHTTNPTRLTDTRYGIGGTSGALASNGTYTMSASVTDEITTTPNPALGLMLTVTDETDSGDFVAYPGGAGTPDASNLNWNPGQNVANLALVPEGTAGTISVTNQDPGTAQLVIDCSGYFAAS